MRFYILLFCFLGFHVDAEQPSFLCIAKSCVEITTPDSRNIHQYITQKESELSSHFNDGTAHYYVTGGEGLNNRLYAFMTFEGHNGSNYYEIYLVVFDFNKNGAFEFVDDLKIANKGASYSLTSLGSDEIKLNIMNPYWDIENAKRHEYEIKDKIILKPSPSEKNWGGADCDTFVAAANAEQEDRTIFMYNKAVDAYFHFIYELVDSLQNETKHDKRAAESLTGTVSKQAYFSFQMLGTPREIYKLCSSARKNGQNPYLSEVLFYNYMASAPKGDIPNYSWWDIAK